MKWQTFEKFAIAQIVRKQENTLLWFSGAILLRHIIDNIGINSIAKSGNRAYIRLVMFLVLAGMPSPQQLIIIALVVVLLFGAKKLPELARSVGKSMGEFRKAREEFDKELESASKTPSSPAVPEQIVSRDDYKAPAEEQKTEEKTEDKA